MLSDIHYINQATIFITSNCNMVVFISSFHSTILDMVKRREQTKMEVLKITVDIFDSR